MMNYYFLVEDEKSFKIILPVWLEFMNFGCKRVQNYQNLTSNSYVLESGKGVTQLETHAIYKTIDTILTNIRHVDKLVIILDAEDIGVTGRKKRLYEEIKKDYFSKGKLIPCSIHVFVCNRCVETWLLGCMGIYPSNKKTVSKYFMPYYDFYDIANNDPELMNKPSNYSKSVSSYHEQYLHALTLDIQKNNKLHNFTYRKSNPNCALREDYFNAMIQRINATKDISTFKEFYDFIITERKNNM